MSGIFISAVTGEFQAFRELLLGDLRRAFDTVREQSEFHNSGQETIEKLESLIQECDAIIHLVGDQVGASPPPGSEKTLARWHGRWGSEFSRLFGDKEPLAPRDPRLSKVSYTQWEAYLALLHQKRLFIYRWQSGEGDSIKGPEPAQRAQQEEHFQRLANLGRDWVGFSSKDRLSSMVLSDLIREEILKPREKTDDSQINVTKVSQVPRDFVGRGQDLDRLTAYWESRKTRLVQLTAWSGVGKTALVAQWLHDLVVLQRHEASRIFAWSFHGQGREPNSNAESSADEFLKKAWEFFGGKRSFEVPSWDRGVLLAHLIGVETGRNLLVLDGVEALQVSAGPQMGELTDPGLSALLSGLMTQNKGLCVVTSRYPVKAAGFNDPLQGEHWKLENLPDAAGAALLHQLGANRSGSNPVLRDCEELRMASRRVEGHALTLHLVGGYVARRYAGDIQNLDQLTRGAVDPDAGAIRMLDQYANRWPEPDGPAVPGAPDKAQMLSILRLVSLFDRPADPVLVSALLKQRIVGLTESLVGISEEGWNEAIASLMDIGLLTRCESRGCDWLEILDRHTSRRERESRVSRFALDAHPLVKGYFSKRLKIETPHAWAEAHGHVCNALIEAHARLEELERPPVAGKTINKNRERMLLAPLFLAVRHGVLAGRASEVLHVVLLAKILKWKADPDTRFWSTDILGEWGETLQAITMFFERPWTRLREEKGAALADGSKVWVCYSAAAMCLRTMRRFEESVTAAEIGYELCEADDRWMDASGSARRLSQTCVATGRLHEAKKWIEKSLTMANERQNGSDPEKQKAAAERLHSLPRLGEVLHHRGEFAAARETFEEAETLLESGKTLTSFSGYEYCDLLLSLAARETDRREALRILEDVRRRALTIEATAEGKALREGLGQLIHARVLIQKASLEPDEAGKLRQQAWELLTGADKAIDRLRVSGERQHLPLGLLPRAQLACDIASASSDREPWLSDAETCLKEVEAIAQPQRDPMRLHWIDGLLARARVQILRGAGSPQQDLEQADALITEVGYLRRRAELSALWNREPPKE